MGFIKPNNNSGGSGGTGSNNAGNISIADTGNYFTSTNVEGALQEAGSQINHNADKINVLNSQLVNKLNKCDSITVSQIDKNFGKIDETYLTDELLQQIAGDTPVHAVIADNSITNEKLTTNSIHNKNIKDNSVDENKISFLENYINYFNPETITHNKHITSTGELGDSSWSTSDFIPVVSGVTYYAIGNIGHSAYYNTNKQFLGIYDGNFRINKIFNPTEDGYIRFSILCNNTSDSRYQNPYEVKVIDTDPNIITFSKKFSANNLIDRSIDGTKLGYDIIEDFHFGVRSDVFKFDINNKKDGYILSDGNEVINDSYCYDTNYYNVEPGEKYLFRYAYSKTGAIYDKDMVFICNLLSGMSGINENVVIELPENAAYVRIISKKDVASEQYFCKGTTPLTSEELKNIVSTKEIPWLKTDILDKVKYKMINEIKNEIKQEITLNPWIGKKFVSLGDSITWQDGNNGINGYQYFVKNNLGFESYINKGVSGRPVVNNSGKGPGTNGTSKTVDYTDLDLVIIASGTNDFKLNSQLGELGQIGDVNLGDTTFYGAYRDMIEYILQQKPTIRIVLFTPLQRDNSGYDVNFVNDAGCKLIDYVNAIKEIGEMYGLPVCDMYANSGFTKLTLDTFTRDGLHPNQIGYNRMGSYASNFIKNIGL